jgi:very-short-patch-repair endonuclease
MGPCLDTDHRIALLAGRQEGVVRHRQLRDLGLTPKAIRVRRERGHLIDLYREVYAVGHRSVSIDGRRLAAAWAYGTGAVLSHRTAAAVWSLRPAGGSAFDVTVPSTAGRVSRSGIRLHRTRGGLETTVHGILPVTTPARTLLDVAGILAPHYVEAALKEADVIGIFDLGALRAVVAAHPLHPGARTLAALLDAAGRTALALTFSDLEIRMRALCDAHGLAQPVANPRPVGFRVDFAWPGTNLIAETDGWRIHRTRKAFEDDRARDQALTVAGFRVVRFTHRQMADDPVAVAATLRALLA